MTRIVFHSLIAIPLTLGLGCGASEDSGVDAGGDPAPCTEQPVFLDGSACEQIGHLLDVSQSCGAGDGYATPSLSASCTADTVEIRSNGIPNFAFVPITPNALTEQDFVWQIPRDPVPATTPGEIPLVGASAVAVNGLPIFGPTEAPQDGSRDPYLDQILDYCNGHTAPGGVYHFHARPECLFSDLEGNTSLVLGYALDGYPILAPYLCADEACTMVEELDSGWQQIEDTYGDTIENAWDAHEYVEGLSKLDECNGMELPDGSYAYFATTTFPYFMGCYHGEATGSVSGIGMPGR